MHGWSKFIYHLPICSSSFIWQFHDCAGTSAVSNRVKTQQSETCAKLSLLCFNVCGPTSLGSFQHKDRLSRHSVIGIFLYKTRRFWDSYRILSFVYCYRYIQLAHFSHDDCEDTCTLSYYHLLIKIWIISHCLVFDHDKIIASYHVFVSYLQVNLVSWTCILTASCLCMIYCVATINMSAVHTDTWHPREKTDPDIRGQKSLEAANNHISLISF